MRNLEYSNLSNINTPYLRYDVESPAGIKILWNSLRRTRIPFLTKWLILQAVRNQNNSIV